MESHLQPAASSVLKLPVVTTLGRFESKSGSVRQKGS
jgi:hypothetical protein